MNKLIPNWMKKWLDLVSKETPIGNQEFIPEESELDNEITITIKYDEWDKNNTIESYEQTR